MKESKQGRALDLVFIGVGVLTTVLLFMPEYYTGYRTAGYVGVGVFLLFLGWREWRRRRDKKEEGGQ